MYLILIPIGKIFTIMFFRIDSKISRTFCEASLHPSWPNFRSSRRQKSRTRLRNPKLETQQRKLGFATRFLSVLQNSKLSAGARDAFNGSDDRTRSGWPDPKPIDRIVRSPQVEKSSKIFLRFVDLSNTLRRLHDRGCHLRVRPQQNNFSVEQKQVIQMKKVISGYYFYSVCKSIST